MASGAMLEMPLHPEQLVAERLDIEDDSTRTTSLWQREKRTVCWSISGIFLGIFVGVTGCFLLVPVAPQHAREVPEARISRRSAVASAAFMSPLRPLAFPSRFGVRRGAAAIPEPNAKGGIGLMMGRFAPSLKSPSKAAKQEQIMDFATDGDEEVSVVLDLPLDKLKEHIEIAKGVATDEGGHEAVDEASKAQEAKVKVLAVEPSWIAPTSEYLLDTFFETWSNQDAQKLSDLLTEDASIHWKSVNPFSTNPWITWTRDESQYCEDDACTVLETYHGKKQDIRAYDLFLKDMDKSFKEDIAKRSIECEEGMVFKVTSEAKVGGVSARVLIHLTPHEGKIKDISIQPVCKHGVR